VTYGATLREFAGPLASRTTCAVQLYVADLCGSFAAHSSESLWILARIIALCDAI